MAVEGPNISEETINFLIKANYNSHIVFKTENKSTKFENLRKIKSGSFCYLKLRKLIRKYECFIFLLFKYIKRLVIVMN